MRMVACIGACAILVCPAQGLAEFTGVIARDASVEVCTPLGLQTVRLYATFSDPTDRIWSVGGGAGITDFLLSLDGGELLNDTKSPFAGIRAEDFPSVPFGAPWDSYVALGAETFFDNEAVFSQGFAGGDESTSVIRGGAVAEDDGGWIDSDPFTATTGSEILIAQLTFDPAATIGFHMHGWVAWGPGGDLMFTAFTMDGVSCSRCRTDLDRDGITSMGDLMILFDAWGTCPDVCCPADLDGSGGIGLQDLLLLLARWSSECACYP